MIMETQPSNFSINLLLFHFLLPNDDAREDHALYACLFVIELVLTLTLLLLCVNCPIVIDVMF